MITAVSSRMLRYAGVSACCALINNALLIGLDAAGLGPLACVLIAAAVMIPSAYALHTRWTYATAVNPASFGRYATVALLNLPGSWLLILLLRRVAQLPMAITAPTVTVALFLLNYLAARWSIAQRPSPTFERGNT